MPRTLKHLGISALEELFATSTTDAKVLKQLGNELQYRQVPRALALQEKVQLAMTGLATSMPTRSQGELPLEPPPTPSHVPIRPPPAPEHVAPAVIVNAPAPQPAPPSVQQPPHPPAQPAAPTTQVGVERPSIPVMSLDEAYKLLKVTLTSPWQEVELSRRKMVLLSHPRHVVGMIPELQESVRTEARRINAAYAVLSAARAR